MQQTVPNPVLFLAASEKGESDIVCVNYLYTVKLIPYNYKYSPPSSILENWE